MSRQQSGDPTTYGPYSQSYNYDQWGNMTTRVGWGGWDAGYVNWAPSYTNNRLTTNPATGAAMQYDGSGNLTNDGYQSYTYDATGQQAYASATALSQSYDGDRLREKKTDNGVTTYYLRSTVLGGQVVAEVDGNGTRTRGYVYAGGQMLAIQQNDQVSWVHQDPVTKSQRVTNSSGTVTGTIDLDPWGGETATSSNQAFQPHRFTSYERDANNGDEAMMRRYTGKWHRFDQPDPYDGSYDLTNPQSFNRYAYTTNDPVNFVDPKGLDPPDIGTVGVVTVTGSWDDMTDYLPDWRSGDLAQFLFPIRVGGGGGGLGGPQNPAIPANLKDQVQGTVTNCADYMNDLLNQLGSKFTVGTFGDLFDRVGMNHIAIDHKEFVKVGEPNAAGLAEDNPRRIFINSGVTAIARVTTFELLHHAATSGMFNDHKLDDAVIKLMNPADQTAARAEMKAKGYMRSTIAHRELNKNCFNKGR